MNQQSPSTDREMVRIPCTYALTVLSTMLFKLRHLEYTQWVYNANQSLCWRNSCSCHNYTQSRTFATIGKKRIATFSKLWNLKRRGTNSCSCHNCTQSRRCATISERKNCHIFSIVAPKTSLWHLKTSNVAGGLPQLAECGTKCATYQDPSPTPNPNPNPSESGASVEHPKGTTEEGLAKARRWALYQKLPSTRL